ncbi:hypothetical protein [Frankia sp. Cas3]|uniref:hypothetical protein n=1 Tax=Frankia sp. Cas3 TaxID=3073926 RepID=UPI002AD300B6|nr:hypothetical protein [Frankia sp. Cas3]
MGEITDYGSMYERVSDPSADAVRRAAATVDRLIADPCERAVVLAMLGLTPQAPQTVETPGVCV